MYDRASPYNLMGEAASHSPSINIWFPGHQRKRGNIYFSHTKLALRIRQICKRISLSVFSVHGSCMVSPDNLPLEHHALGKLKKGLYSYVASCRCLAGHYRK